MIFKQIYHTIKNSDLAGEWRATKKDLRITMEDVRQSFRDTADTLREVRNFFFPYRYDERNPARRYCRECGQQQDLYGVYDRDPLEGGKFIPSGWETMYPLSKKRCSREH